MLLLLMAVPPIASSRSIDGKFVYTLASVDCYTVPQTVQKKSPDGTPLPSASRKIGFVRAGSLLEILERQEYWLKIREVEGGSLQGWIRRSPQLTSSNPRLYFQLELDEGSFEGYGIFNASSDLSGGSVRSISLRPDLKADHPIDLEDCLKVGFAGNRVTVTLRGAKGEVKTICGQVEKGACYLVSSRTIKLNQSGRTFHLTRTRVP
jgi:hypothetical protein